MTEEKYVCGVKGEANVVGVDPLTPANDALSPEICKRVRFNNDGLVAAVVQDAVNGDVLMVAYMDAVALARTLHSGRVWFWSRSRQEYWCKGDTSGHIQLVREVFVDCDGDCLLVRAVQVGAACHEGTRTCFQTGGSLPVSLVIPEDASCEVREDK